MFYGCAPGKYSRPHTESRAVIFVTSHHLSWQCITHCTRLAWIHAPMQVLLRCSTPSVWIDWHPHCCQNPQDAEQNPSLFQNTWPNPQAVYTHIIIRKKVINPMSQRKSIDLQCVCVCATTFLTLRATTGSDSSMNLSTMRSTWAGPKTLRLPCFVKRNLGLFAGCTTSGLRCCSAKKNLGMEVQKKGVRNSGEEMHNWNCGQMTSAMPS